MERKAPQNGWWYQEGMATLRNQTEPILIHNVDILKYVDLEKFYQMESKELLDDSSDSVKQKAPLAARLLVSERKTKRYLLFDDTMRLVGWTNIETGEVKRGAGSSEVSNYEVNLSNT